MSDSNLVRVNILGKEYGIKSDNPARVARIAEYLNERAAEQRAKSPGRNIVDLSVMTAFQAVSDYFDALDLIEGQKAEIEKRAARLAARIDGKFSGDD